MQHQGATTRNTASGQYGFNYYNRVGGRVAARWTPIDGLTIDASYDQAKDENTPNYSQLIDYNPLGKTVGVYIVNPALVNPNLTREQTDFILNLTLAVPFDERTTFTVSGGRFARCDLLPEEG